MTVVNTSVFISLLKKLSVFVHSLICTSKTAQALTSYDSVNKKSTESLIAKILFYVQPRKKKIIDAKNVVSESI